MRQQQYYVTSLLDQMENLGSRNAAKLQVIIDIMTAAGIAEETRWIFHNHLETMQPDCHQAFLEMLGLNLDEIKQCREWAINKTF